MWPSCVLYFTPLPTYNRIHKRTEACKDNMELSDEQRAHMGICYVLFLIKKIPPDLQLILSRKIPEEERKISDVDVNHRERNFCQEKVGDTRRQSHSFIHHVRTRASPFPLLSLL